MGLSDTAIDKLGQDNYGVWAPKMKAKLMAKAIWNCVSNPPDPPDIVNDQKALALITLNVDNSWIPQLQSCATARDAWQLLESTWRANIHAQALAKQRDWAQLTMFGNETIIQFFARAGSLRADLRLCGVDIERERQLTEKEPKRRQRKATSSSEN